MLDSKTPWSALQIKLRLLPHRRVLVTDLRSAPSKANRRLCGRAAADSGISGQSKERPSMNNPLNNVKWGLALALLGLGFGIALGIYFGINEDAILAYIANGIAAHPTLHDAKSQDAIWRYVQRAHFHATGIGAFSIGLILIVALSDLSALMKMWTSLLIGLGGLYPVAWYTTFYLSPSLGRSAAHEHWATLTLVYVSISGLVVGMAIMVANLFLGFARSRE
jgi:hypothetical protein